MSQLICLFSLIFLVFSVYSCNYKAYIRSETDRDIYAQFTFYNKTMGEVMKFTKYGETRNLTFTGTLCNIAPTTLKTYNEYPKKGVKPFGETSAFFEGSGQLWYKLYPKDGPAAVRSEGIFCMFGQCRIGK